MSAAVKTTFITIIMTIIALTLLFLFMNMLRGANYAMAFRTLLKNQVEYHRIDLTSADHRIYRLNNSATADTAPTAGYEAFEKEVVKAIKAKTGGAVLTLENTEHGDQNDSNPDDGVNFAYLTGTNKANVKAVKIKTIAHGRPYVINTIIKHKITGLDYGD